MRLPQVFIILSVILSLRLGEDELEAVAGVHPLDYVRVEFHPLEVLLHCEPLKEATSSYGGLLLGLQLVMYLLAVLHRHLQYVEHVLDQVGLHLLVDRGVMIEGGQVVDLQEPRLQLPVQHDVEAEELVADVRLAWLCRLVVVLQLWLDSNDRFYDNVLDLCPDLVR